MAVSFVSGVDEGGRRPSIDGFHCELARASTIWAEFVPENGGGAGVRLKHRGQDRIAGKQSYVGVSGPMGSTSRMGCFHMDRTKGRLKLAQEHYTANDKAKEAG